MLEEEIRGLKAVMTEKRHELRQSDSAVRLQNASLEMEARLFAAPFQSLNTSKSEYVQPRQERPKRSPLAKPVQDLDWVKLLGEPISTDS